MKKRNESVRVAATARLVVLALIALALVLGGCRQSFDYYNPLDPAEDGPISEILPLIEDGAIRQAIIDSGAQRKSELGWLNVEGGVYGNVTTTAGLEFFSFTDNVRLVEASVEAADLSALSKMRQLRYLDLERNQFDDTSVRSIPFIPRLDFLQLGTNSVFDTASLVPFLEPYGRGQLFLDIGANNISKARLAGFQPVLDRLNGLNITHLVDDLVDLNVFAPNDTIRYLDFSRNGFVNDLSGLSRFTGLDSFRAEDLQINDVVFQTIPYFPHDRFWGVNIRRNNITNLSAVASYISRYPRYRINLGIGENPFSTAALWDLAPAFESMHRLDLNWHGWWDPAFVPGPVVDLYFLPVNDTVNALHVSGNDVTDISAISRLRDLRDFSMEGNRAAFISGYSSLLDLPRLERVNVRDNAYVDFGVLDELMSRGVWVE